MGDWYPRMTVFTEQVLVRMALFLEARGTFIRKIISFKFKHTRGMFLLRV